MKQVFLIYLSNIQFINPYNKYNKFFRKMMKIGKFFFKENAEKTSKN